MTELSPEDAKLVTLARSARVRVNAAQGAAVRDTDGRTYAAASVALPSLRLAALQVCVAMALSSGSRGLEAAVLLGDEVEPGPADRAVLFEFGGPDVVLHLADPKGAVLSTGTSGG